VAIASKPDGAMVWIDGEERCKTPCTVKLKPGSARLALVHAGYLSSQSSIDVRDGAKVDATLQSVAPPMEGEARFRAECKTEGKFPIVVDGKETGILCPYSKMRVEPGSHTIGVLVPSTGKVHDKGDHAFGRCSQHQLRRLIGRLIHTNDLLNAELRSVRTLCGTSWPSSGSPHQRLDPACVRE
jgi:hypothetical protein